MNEIQRQAYLSAMGIDGYMARWVLPGAPASVQCELPVMAQLPEAVATASSQPAGGTAQRPEQGREASVAATDVLGELNIGPGAKPATKVKSTPAAPVEEKPAAREVPHFALTVWRVSDELMVIDSRQAQLALPTERLLANMLGALGYPRQALPKAEIIRWPLLENTIEDQGEAEAREMLHAFLDAHLLLNPARHLLLMGPEATRYILPPLDSYGEDWFTAMVGQQASLKALDSTAVVAHSLTDMLQNPSLKSDTWRAIQPLCLPSR